MKDIIVAKISLHYEARPTIIQVLSRERYARKLQEQKSGKDYHNYYFKRITEKERDRIRHYVLLPENNTSHLHGKKEHTQEQGME